MITLEAVKQAIQEKAKVKVGESQVIAQKVVETCEKELSQGILAVHGLTTDITAIDMVVKHFENLGFKVERELRTYSARSTRRKAYTYSKHSLIFSVD